MIAIAVTAVGGGVGQSILRGLQYSHTPYRTIGFDISSMSAGLYWTDRAYLMPPVTDHNGYQNELTKYTIQENIDILIPGIDTELPFLAEIQDTLPCKVLIASSASIRICRDKFLSYQFCAKRGLPFVLTYYLGDALDQLDTLQFPVIVKPTGGSASAGVHLITDVTGLQKFKENPTSYIVQRYLPINSDDDGTTHRQKEEVSVQFYVSSTGHILGSFASVNILKHGVPMEIVPQTDEVYYRDARKIAEALIEVGLRGPLNLQGRRIGDSIEFFELNARYTGITMVRSGMGYREVEAGVLDIGLGLKDEAIGKVLHWEPGYLGLRYTEQTIIPQKTVTLLESNAIQKSRLTSEPQCSKILITGASGYVGRALLKTLLESHTNKEIVAFVSSDQQAAQIRQEFDDADLLLLSFQFGRLPEQIPDLSDVDTVIHLAGYRDLTGDTAEMFSVNFNGTTRLAKACEESGVNTFLFLSSHAVYGTSRPPLWSESFVPSPEGPYGISRWAAEMYLRQLKIPNLHILRAPRVYGRGLRIKWKEVPHLFIQKLYSGEKLTITGEGGQTLDLLHVEDLVSAIEICIAAPRHGDTHVFNVGSCALITLKKLALLCEQVIREKGKKTKPINFLNSPNISPNFGMDCRKIISYLSWTPRVSLKDGLAGVVDELASKKCSKFDDAIPVRLP